MGLEPKGRAAVLEALAEGIETEAGFGSVILLVWADQVDD